MKDRTLQWDGKCAQCRKLMSQCMCFQERADRLADQRRPELEIKADQRPLYNALRKMHSKTAAPFLSTPPPAADARRDRTQSHNLPPRPHPGQRRDPRLRLLSTSAAGVPAAPLKATASLPAMVEQPPPKLQAPRVHSGVLVTGLHVTRRPSSAPGHASSSSSSSSSSRSRNSSGTSRRDPAAAKRASIDAANPARSSTTPSSASSSASVGAADASPASTLKPAGGAESYDSTDGVWEL